MYQCFAITLAVLLEKGKITATTTTTKKKNVSALFFFPPLFTSSRGCCVFFVVIAHFSSPLCTNPNYFQLLYSAFLHFFFLFCFPWKSNAAFSR